MVDVLASVFKPDLLCAGCDLKFSLISKRRKCAVCSSLHLEKIFCKKCSIKVPDQHLGMLNPTRYCKTCYDSSVANSGLIKGTGASRHSARIAPAQSSEVPHKPHEPEAPTEIQFDQALFRAGTMRSTDPYETYTLIKQLGVGASGSVSLVQHRETQVQYALKLVIPRSERMEDQIINEIALVQISKHPNIMEYLESYHYQGGIYMVVELLEITLTTVVDQTKGSLPERDVLYILKEVLKGMQFMHAQHRIHRDLKSDNILLSRDGKVKIGDFGAAAQLTQEREARSTVIGTPLWMAPEQLRGDEYDCKVDIWALGIIALELTEGEPPYIHLPQLQAQMNIVANDPPRLRNKLRWSPGFNELVAGCLQKNPQERLSAGQLLSLPVMEYVVETAREQFEETLVALHLASSSE